MTAFAVLLEGLEGFDLSEIDQKKITTAARRAINETARSGRAKAAKRIRQQVNFPGSYVAPGQKRLYVSEQAQGSRLQATITAQARNTSLARFVVGDKTPSKQGGLYVKVGASGTRFMKRAFLIRLKSGNNPITDTVSNLGLALRLKPGETLQNKRTARRIASGLYLLYGPSVDQVFRSLDGSGVATDLVPDLQGELQSEFLRQLAL